MKSDVMRLASCDVTIINDINEFKYFKDSLDIKTFLQM